MYYFGENECKYQKLVVVYAYESTMIMSCSQEFFSPRGHWVYITSSRGTLIWYGDSIISYDAHSLMRYSILQIAKGRRSIRSCWSWNGPACRPAAEAAGWATTDATRRGRWSSRPWRRWRRNTATTSSSCCGPGKRFIRFAVEWLTRGCL